MMILVSAYDAWSEAFTLAGAVVLVDLFPLVKSSYEDYTEHFSVSLRRKTSPNLLSVMLSRRI
jgi:hypothetical protein